MVDNRVRSVSSMSLGPLLHFFACEVRSLVRRNGEWNLWPWVRHGSLGGSLGRKSTHRNDESKTIISIYCSKDKALSVPGMKRPNVVTLSPGRWLITLGNGTISGTQYWCLLFADLVLSSSWWTEVQVMKSIHHLHPCHHGHNIHGPIRQWQGWLDKEAEWPKRSLYLLDYWTPQLKSPFSEHL